jgi:hypothetical protein
MDRKFRGVSNRRTGQIIKNRAPRSLGVIETKRWRRDLDKPKRQSDVTLTEKLTRPIDGTRLNHSWN